MRSGFKRFAAVQLLTFALLIPLFAQEEPVIVADSVGGVRVGMTVAEARRTIPYSILKRTSDGEGIALIAVEVFMDVHMVLFAGESDPDSPIDENAKIEAIEVVSPNYRTPEGLSPGMKIADAEKKVGKLTGITMSEIESREYATFEKGPEGIMIRLQNKDGFAGIYPEGSSKTAKAAPGTFIYSISVSGKSGDESRAGIVDVSEYNSMISEAAKNNESWTRSPMGVVIKLAGEFSEIRSRSIEMTAPTAEGSDRITVTVIDDGFLDDSVRGEKTVYELKQDHKGVWGVESATRAWKCWKGRGHTEFAARPCI